MRPLRKLRWHFLGRKADWVWVQRRGLRLLIGATACLFLPGLALAVKTKGRCVFVVVVRVSYVPAASLVPGTQQETQHKQ